VDGVVGDPKLFVIDMVGVVGIDDMVTQIKQIKECTGRQKGLIEYRQVSMYSKLEGFRLIL